MAFVISEQFPVSASTLYIAWLNSEQHSAMTGGDAVCSNQEGGEFSAWDGYITGTNKSLTPDTTIIQNWRTTEFSVDDEDSVVSVSLKDNENGCELTLIHTNIPQGQPDYQQGWIEHYFEPMKAYFIS